MNLKKTDFKDRQQTNVLSLIIVTPLFYDNNLERTKTNRPQSLLII